MDWFLKVAQQRQWPLVMVVLLLKQPPFGFKKRRTKSTKESCWPPP
jgi:hypothetical protein